MSTNWSNLNLDESPKQIIRVKDFFKDNEPDEIFLDFDLTEIQELVKQLQNETVHDVAAADNLQRQALVCADLLAEYIAKLIKIISHLDVKESRIRNKVSLEFNKGEDGKAASMALRKLAGDASEEAEEVGYIIAKAKGTKALLEKKYDVIIKAHHFYKEISQSFRKNM
jgi:hypothetical protein